MVQSDKQNRVIAFSGKGGVGKTSLAALTVRLLTDVYPDKKILAIDADPAIGLSTALEVNVTTTVDDIRLKFVRNAELKKASTTSAMAEAECQITDAIIDCGKFAFLAIGRPESAGCYCAVNAFLKEIISGVCDDFDYIIIDGEAGIEQINRRVMEKVTDLILVSDASRKGIDVITMIRNVAKSMEMFERAGAIINRVKNKEMADKISLGDVPLLGFIYEDDELQMLDIEGRSLMNLSADALTIQNLRKALIEVDIIK